MTDELEVKQKEEGEKEEEVEEEEEKEGRRSWRTGIRERGRFFLFAI